MRRAWVGRSPLAVNDMPSYHTAKRALNRLKLAIIFVVSLGLEQRRTCRSGQRREPAWPEQEKAMRSHTKYLTMKVPVRMDFVNITPEVIKAVEESSVREGLCLVNAMHITASVFINDDEPGLHEDYKRWLEWLAPFDPSPERYHHNRSGEDNGDAHHKRQVMGREVVVAVTKGKLDFGPWEQIFYGEFDGRRPKRILIKVIGE
jgi:secondary thiamine-phosphate synthase enzyme